MSACGPAAVLEARLSVADARLRRWSTCRQRRWPRPPPWVGAPGLTGLEALVCHAASGEVGAEVLRTTRAYSEDEWAAGVEALAARDLVTDDGRFTDLGRAAREEVERVTDEPSSDPYEVIGEDGIDRLRALARPFAKDIVAAAFR